MSKLRATFVCWVLLFLCIYLLVHINTRLTQSQYMMTAFILSVLFIGVVCQWKTVFYEKHEFI
jgi:hypothetical protein